MARTLIMLPSPSPSPSPSPNRSPNSSPNPKRTVAKEASREVSRGSGGLGIGGGLAPSREGMGQAQLCIKLQEVLLVNQTAHLGER